MFLAEAAVVLIVAKLTGELAGRWDQPPVLGQLLGGLVLGVGLSFVDNPALHAAGIELGSLANLGVVLLMFLAGLETDWDQLRATGKAAFVAASLGVVAPLVGGYALALLFGLPTIEALFVGVILTATSVSITAQTLMEMGSLQTVEGATVLGAAVIDDVIGLVVFSLVVALTNRGTEQDNLGWLAAYLLVFFVVSATLAPWLIPRLLRLAERFRGAEAMLAIAVAIGLLYGVAAERAGSRRSLAPTWLDCSSTATTAIRKSPNARRCWPTGCLCPSFWSRPGWMPTWKRSVRCWSLCSRRP